MKRLVVLVGPPGAGKSTLSKEYEANGYVRINRDDQGHKAHFDVFDKAIAKGEDVIVDKMNFDMKRRAPWLSKAKEAGYITKVIVLYVPYDACLKRALGRENHPTVKCQEDAIEALNCFFSRYERVQDNEADSVEHRGHVEDGPMCVVSDLDGTLCNTDWRQHLVQVPEGQKKNWKAFFEGIPNDPVHEWCREVLHKFENHYPIILASGRSERYREMTREWLYKHNIAFTWLFMRNEKDSRQDYLAKETILDFEILTRYRPLFVIDDRQQVVDMWRKRGLTCLQCNDGKF